MSGCLYRVDWNDRDGHHTDQDLTWPEARAEYHRLDLIVGNRDVRISSYPVNPGPAGAATETVGRPGTDPRPTTPATRPVNGGAS